MDSRRTSSVSKMGLFGDQSPPIASPQKEKNVTEQIPITETEIKKQQNFNIDYRSIDFGKKIGKGCFGSVFKGTWDAKLVAIKVMCFANEENRLACEKEKNIMQRLHAPNIVEFYGCSQTSSMYYIVMEWMSQGSLEDMIDEKRLPKWDGRYKFIIDIGTALCYLHSENIVHCDIKPGNIVFDEKYNAKLCDFGFTKEIDNKEDRRGSPLWLAPEFFLACFHTKKTDMFAFAVVIWQLAAERDPYIYQCKNNDEVASFLRSGKRESIPFTCKPKIRQIITWLWKQEPEQRCSAADLSTELKTDIDTVSERLQRIKF